MMGVILSVGRSPELLRTRALLLRSNGFVVIEATDCERAMQIALHDHVDLVLLCHSLKKSETSLLIASVAQQRRLIPVLCIRKNDFATVPRGCESAASSPDLLLSRITVLLGQKAKDQMARITEKDNQDGISLDAGPRS